MNTARSGGARRFLAARWLACLAFGLMGVPAPAQAWGFTAHRLVERRAIDALPEPLRALFRGNAEWLAEHSIDPDLWRTAGRPDEGPAHFLDMDAFGDELFRRIPSSEAEHRARHGAEAEAKGRVPWRVAEVYGELTEAFRSRDAGKALAAASALGHYVSDAHVPFHAALNYDGQLTNQNGIHARWEEAMVDRFLGKIQASLPRVEPRAATSPVQLVFAVLRSAFGAVDHALRSDRSCTTRRDDPSTTLDERYDARYFRCLFEREKPTLIASLDGSSASIAALWTQAWVDAGRPPVDTAFRFAYVRRQARGILVSIDGAAAPLVDDAVRRGLMPRLAALRARGATASGVTVSLPAKTATGHATLYTGAWPARHGITGNEFVPEGARVTETVSGFSSVGLRAEPIWVAAARQGLDVTVAQATQASPFAPFLEERRFGGNYSRTLNIIDGFQALDVPDVVHRGEGAHCGSAEGWVRTPAHKGALRGCQIEVAGATISLLFFDDPADPVDGYDTVLAAAEPTSPTRATLKAGRLRDDAASFGRVELSVRAGRTAAFLRLFELKPDGSDWMLYRSRLRAIKASRPNVESAAFAATGGVVGNGASDLYRRGQLGKTLLDGGDGTAEGRYLETVALAIRQTARLGNFAARQTRWDLLITYLAYPDEALHLWAGFVDSTLPDHDPVLARRIGIYVDRVLALVDGYVGEIATSLDARTVMAVATDHGFIGARRTLRPNVVLAKAGLLSLDGKGAIDPSATRVLYPSNNSGYLLINRATRPGGTVRPEDEGLVRQQAATALLAVRDPSGDRVVAKVVAPASGEEPGIGGPTGGDLYLDVPPGTSLSGSFTGPAIESIAPEGVHLLSPQLGAMQGAFVVAGHGVARGALGQIRQIDIAPTLCRLLGIEPPAQAEGAVVDAALARRDRADVAPASPRELSSKRRTRARN